MMEVSKGDIVQSLNGRDKGKALFVAEREDEYLILVDGKSRKIEHPKRKKEKHCMFLASDSCRVAQKLKSGEKVGNSEIRRALAAFLNAGAQDQTTEEVS